MPNVEHRSYKGLDNRAENSHVRLRKRERSMQGLSWGLQRFVSNFSALRILFVQSRHKRLRHPHSSASRYGGMENRNRDPRLLRRASVNLTMPREEFFRTLYAIGVFFLRGECSRTIDIHDGFAFADANKNIVDVVATFEDLATMDSSTRKESVITLADFEGFFAILPKVHADAT
jgi:putative transposase